MSKSNSRSLIWGALAISVWTVSCFAVGARGARCRRRCDTVSCSDLSTCCTANDKSKKEDRQ